MNNNSVIYARYSAGPRQTDQSIEGQIADCRRYAEQNGLMISKVYADKHVSGRSTDGRDEFLQMIADAKKGLFSDLIVWKIDRFGRDKTDIAIYKRELKKAGVTIHYAAENVPDGPEGIILESLLEGLAEYYSADLRQKVERGMRESLKKGQYPGKLPYGYKKDEQKHVVVDRDQAETVRLIYKLHAEGNTIAEICRILSKKGLKMSNGTIYRILTNEHYLGKFEMMGIEIDVEPIVSTELFAKSNEMFKEHKNKGKANVNYILSGKCKCAVCGGTITGTHGTGRHGGKFYYYQCKNHCFKPLQKEKYEQKIIAAVKENMLTDDLIENIIDRIMDIQKDDLPNADIKRLQAQIKDIQKRRNNLLSAIENGLYSPEMNDRINDLNAQEELLTDELSRLQIKKPIIPREYLKWWLTSFRSGDLTDEQYCRKILNTFVCGVAVSPDYSTIFLNVTNEKEGSNDFLKVNLKEIQPNPTIPVVKLPYLLIFTEN